MGIYGWSYGGYLSALCLARRPDVFRAACAGAPVTGWDGYDTHYTERYMGTPAENPDGYEQAAVMTHVAGLRDRSLLLVHGLIDENVHFRHSARLVNAMIRAGIDHELFLFPDERHVPRAEADRSFMEDRIERVLPAHTGAPAVLSPSSTERPRDRVRAGRHPPTTPTTASPPNERRAERTALADAWLALGEERWPRNTPGPSSRPAVRRGTALDAPPTPITFVIHRRGPRSTP